MDDNTIEREIASGNQPVDEVHPTSTPAPPARTPEQRINDILAEGNHTLLPVLIAPVSKTPVPVIDFLAEYINGGWSIDWRLVEQR